MTEKQQKSKFILKINQNLYIGPAVIAATTFIGYLFNSAGLPETGSPGMV